MADLEGMKRSACCEDRGRVCVCVGVGEGGRGGGGGRELEEVMAYVSGEVAFTVK